MGEGDNAMFHNILTLNNGIKIPQLGLGTWFIHDDIVVDAIKKQLMSVIDILILHRYMETK